MHCLNILTSQSMPMLILLTFFVVDARHYNTKQNMGKVLTVLERSRGGRFQSLQDRKVLEQGPVKMDVKEPEVLAYRLY